jgi:hypothetical protein
MLGFLEVGHAVVRTADSKQPVHVKVKPPSDDYHQLLLSGPITDDMIRQHNLKDFEDNPQLQKSLEVPESIMFEDSKMVYGIDLNLDLSTIEMIHELIDTKNFGEYYAVAIGEAGKGRPTIGALIIIKTAEIVIDDDTKLSTHCDFLTWYLSRGETDSDTRRAHESVRGELKDILDSDLKLSSRQDQKLQWYYERIQAEVLRRKRTHRRTFLKPEERVSLLKDAVLEAIKERNQAKDSERGRSDSTVSPNDVETSNPVAISRLRRVVMSNRFAKLYTDALLESVEEQNHKYVSLVMESVRTSTPSNESVPDVAVWLVSHLRDELDAPEDDELFMSLVSDVRETVTA